MATITAQRRHAGLHPKGTGLAAGFLLLLAATAAIAAPQPLRPLDQLDIRVFATDEGLPHDSALSLAMDGEGALWVGSWGGLTRYDGFEFRTFDRTIAPDIIDNGVLSITPLRDGSLALGMQGGQLVQSSAGSLRVLAGPEQGIEGNVLSVIEGEDGIWLGIEGGGLWRWHDGRLSRSALAELGAPASVYALSAGNDGSLLAATSRGVYRLSMDGQRGEPVAPDGPWISESPAVLAVAESPDGTLWVGTDTAVYRFTASGEWQNVAAVSVQTFLLDRAGLLWVGTAASGVLRVNDDAVEQLDRRQGLPDVRVRAILEDRAGGIWLGTNAGLVVLRELPFRGLTARQGLAGEYVRSFMQLPDGRVLVAGSGGLYEVDGTRVALLATEAGEPESQPESLLSLALDSTDKLWIGTYADGLRRLGPSGPEPLPDALRFAGRAVRALLFAQDGSLWVGMREGLSRVDPVDGRRLPLAVVAADATVLALHQDPTGTVWVGTTSGLRRIAPDGEELAIDGAGPATRRPAFAFADGQPGEVWVGTSDGVLRLTKGRIDLVEHGAGLPFFRVLQLLRDPDGSIWMGSERGVFRVLESDLRAVATGRKTSLEGRLFGRDDGMPSRQCNGVAGPAAIRTREGELWFATARGAAIVDPSRIDERPRSPVEVRLERVAINDRELPIGEFAELPPGRHSLQARFGAVDLTNPGQIQFAWRIAGFDPEWRELGRDRTLRVNDLASGRHTLLVAARHAGGEWSAEPARFDYNIPTTLRERAWFLPALIGFVVIVVGTLARFRSRALRAREAELARRVDEQTAALAREMARLSEREAEKSRLLGEIERKSLELERLAREDGLTGLANRRHFDERFESAVARSTTDGPALLMIDVDHFKQINDQHSHRTGDAVLARIAGLMLRSFPDGLSARYGGEEFIVMLENLTRPEALQRAERFRREVETTPWAALANGLSVTVSVGVAMRSEARDADRVVALADDRLYQAKRSGRNRVC